MFSAFVFFLNLVFLPVHADEPVPAPQLRWISPPSFVLEDVRAHTKQHLPWVEYPEAPAADPMPNWAYKAIRHATDAFVALVQGILPDSSGFDWPNASSNTYGLFSTPMTNGSKFRWVMQGRGNLWSLRTGVLYSDIQGGMGIEYDLMPESPTGEPIGTIIALRFFPAYAEIAFIRPESGEPPIQGLPSSLFFSSVLGAEISRKFGPVTAGAQVNFGVEENNSQPAPLGFPVYGVVYTRFTIKSFGRQGGSETGLFITPQFQFFNQGRAHANLDMWNPVSINLAKTADGFDRLWQASVWLEARY